MSCAAAGRPGTSLSLFPLSHGEPAPPSSVTDEIIASTHYMPTQFKILGMFVLSTLRQLQAGAGTIITGILDITDEVMEISEQRNGQGHTAGEGGQARPVAVWGALNPGPHHRRAFAHQGQSPFLGSTPSHQLQVTTPAQASAPSVRPFVHSSKQAQPQGVPAQAGAG